MNGTSQQHVLTFLKVHQLISRSQQSHVHDVTFRFCIIFVIILCDDSFHVEQFIIPKVMEQESFPKFCIIHSILQQKTFLYKPELHLLLANEK
jgi:hypothetical protein